MFTADTETVGQTDDLQERISKVRSGLMQANLLELVDKLSNASETIDQVFTGVRQAQSMEDVKDEYGNVMPVSEEVSSRVDVIYVRELEETVEKVQEKTGMDFDGFLEFIGSSAFKGKSNRRRHERKLQLTSVLGFRKNSVYNLSQAIQAGSA